MVACGVRSVIDRAGRLRIPKRMLDRLGIQGRTPVELLERDGRLEVVPACVPMTLERRGGALVAVPAHRIETLTDALVRETIERSRR